MKEVDYSDSYSLFKVGQDFIDSIIIRTFGRLNETTRREATENISVEIGKLITKNRRQRIELSTIAYIQLEKCGATSDVLSQFGSYEDGLSHEEFIGQFT